LSASDAKGHGLIATKARMPSSPRAVNLRARYYDPTMGQFLSRDPLSALTRSPYGYAGDNPLIPEANQSLVLPRGVGQLTEAHVGLSDGAGDRG
jgi:hypothetical protein